MIKINKKINYLIFFIFLCLITLFFLVYYQKNGKYWFFSYVKWELQHTKTNKKPKHIIFLITDHFEPTTLENVKEWTTRWPSIIDGHADSNGIKPQYTWFYFFDGYKSEVLSELAKLPRMGLGEIEIHLHHSNDTPETFRYKIKAAKELYKKVGAIETIDGEERFAYIAGNWSLDNSVIRNGHNYSGVNNELTILREEGCYADFTFPTLSMAMPKMINTIYYATDDPIKPKSYNKGTAVEVGKSSKFGDFMIFMGPFSINFRDWHHVFYPAINTGNIQASNPPSQKRVDDWIRVGIHVKNKPEWIFVKCHTHGAHPPIREVLLSSKMSEMFTYLEKTYNDGENYILHYVTAREAYNIVKAAEAGKNGNPNIYRDFIIKPYLNSTRKLKQAN